MADAGSSDMAFGAITEAINGHEMDLDTRQSHFQIAKEYADEFETRVAEADPEDIEYVPLTRRQLESDHAVDLNKLNLTFAERLNAWVGDGRRPKPFVTAAMTCFWAA